MAETAVGLFEQLEEAQAVVASLHAQGLPAQGIRTLSERSQEGPGGGFGTSLTKDLRAIGATEEEAAAYVRSLRGGSALVFVSGTAAEVSAAKEVMNDFSAVEVEEFAGSIPGTATQLSSRGAGEGAVTVSGRTTGVAEPSAEATASTSDPNVTAKIEHHRKRTEGARVFSW